MPVRPSAWNWTDFHEILHLSVFRKFVFRYYLTRITALQMKTDIHLSLYLIQFFFE